MIRTYSIVRDVRSGQEWGQESLLLTDQEGSVLGLGECGGVGVGIAQDDADSFPGRTLQWAGELDADGWYRAEGEEPEEDEKPEAPNYANLFPLHHTRSNA